MELLKVTSCQNSVGVFAGYMLARFKHIKSRVTYGDASLKPFLETAPSVARRA